MSEHTPSTGTVRVAYVTSAGEHLGIDRDEASAEFDRWLNQQRARIWDEAYGTGVADAWTSMEYDGGATPAARVNPYRQATP